MTEIESKENIHRRFILQQYSLLNSIEKFICVVRHLHRETCTIVHVMNQVYSKSILLELIGHFTHILFILYALYFTIGSISLANFPNLINIIYTTIWLIYFVSKFVITNILGQAVSNEAALTKQILQEINPSYLQDEARKELQQFAMQLELCPLNVCAAGFLTLDNAFTTHFFGGVTTYLVIFIQMSSSSSAYATV
ncbi:putative gustatory receptor 28b [Prorops nasuta]|uniref:putative gustatory receptor 28b n=1 Tax=Prorops nasuta TaxID=863751 RepID=UPI0034CD4D15